MTRPPLLVSVSVRMLATAAALLAFATVLASCSGDDEESGSTRPPSPSAIADADGFGGGGGGEPDPALVEALQSLPVFPGAESASLAQGRYRIDNYNEGIIWASFGVSPQTTANDVISFFAKEVPPGGWQEEGPARTETVEGKVVDLQTGERGPAVSTVLYSFLKGGTRLLIEIPIGRGPKDETPPPSGVASVNLILAPKEIQFNGPSVGTPIDSTPPSTPSVITPTCAADQRPCYAPAPETH